MSVSLVKICHSCPTSAPEFINLHLKDNSGTGHWPYVLWLLDSLPPLGFGARQRAICLWCSFIPTTSPLSSIHVGILNLLCTLQVLNYLSHNNSFQLFCIPFLLCVLWCNIIPNLCTIHVLIEQVCILYNRQSTRIILCQHKLPEGCKS